MDLVKELIMLLEMELSHIELRLVAMTQDNPEWDVLDILKKEVTEQIQGYKDLVWAFNEGKI
jgi:hypothetical protein